MRKIVVVNSFGPMGSTLLAGLLEKMNFTNVPIRKQALHQYLLGQYDQDSGIMQNNLRKILATHAIPDFRGGVSVLDRNNQQARALVDLNRVGGAVDKIKAGNVQDLYFQCREVYCRAVIYKTITTPMDRQVELTTDIHRYNHKALYDAYRKNFDDVRMIHLHRPFKNWINSLASQAFLHTDFIQRVKFFPHMRYNDYALYEEAVAAMPGLHLEFDELFTPIEGLAQKIAAFLEVDPPSVDLRAESYDLYGKNTPYEKAFTKFDDKITYLRPGTLQYFDDLTRTGGIKKTDQKIITWLRYITDMVAYRMKKAA